MPMTLVKVSGLSLTRHIESNKRAPVSPSICSHAQLFGVRVWGKWSATCLPFLYLLPLPFHYPPFLYPIHINVRFSTNFLSPHLL